MMDVDDLDMVGKRSAVYESCPIEIYSASSTSMLDYPYRLQHVNESSPNVSGKSDSFILDSDIGDDDVENIDLLDRAEYLNADYLIPKDYIGDPYETTWSVVEFMRLYNDHEWDGNIFLPIQSNDELTHVDHYRQLDSILDEYDYETPTDLCVGGIKDASTKEQFTALSTVRQELGSEAWIHALGMGCSLEWMKIVRRCPNVIDSLDMSSATKNALSGKVVDKQLNIMKFDTPRGVKSTTLTSHLATYNLLMMNYMMSENPRDSEIDETIEDTELEQLVTEYESQTFDYGVTQPTTAD